MWPEDLSSQKSIDSALSRVRHRYGLMQVMLGNAPNCWRFYSLETFTSKCFPFDRFILVDSMVGVFVTHISFSLIAKQNNGLVLQMFS